MINRPEWVNAKTKHVVGPLVPNFDPYPYGCRVQWIPNWCLFWFFSRHGLLIHITIVGLYKPKSQRNLDLRKIPLKPQLAVLGCIMCHVFLDHDISCASHLYIAGCPFPIYQAAKFSSTAPSQSHHLSRAPVAQSARNLAVEPSQAAVIKRQWTACCFYSFLENKTNEWYGSL